MLVRDLVLNTVVSSSLVPRRLRWRLLALLGAEVDECSINPSVWIASRRLAIGRGTFVNHGCRIDNNCAWVRIGADCSLAPEVALLTATHEIGPSSRRAGPIRDAPITIGDGVWIGARAVVLAGVTVGDGAVIAAGAVVTEDCVPDGLYAGVPARLRRTLPREP